MRQPILLSLALLILAASTAIPFPAGAASPGKQQSCDRLLPPLRQVQGNRVGPETCRMQRTELEYNGRRYVRLDIGLDGSVEGWVTKDGDYNEYLTNAPELVFPQAQASEPRQPYLAVARYERLRGAAVLLFYPENRRDWNGKLWVTAHGRGRSFHKGNLKAWDRYLDPEHPVADLNKLQKVMLAKGYALAVTRRTSAERLGEIIARLSDGTTVDWVAFNDSHSLIKDYTFVAEAAVKRYLGKTPSRTYLYGKSAGARLARGMNYLGSRLNVDGNGRHVFDGFLVDDSAAGTWLPVVMKNGKDVLLTTEKEKEAFAPQLELVHQMYVNFNDHDLPDFVTNSFLANKYNNARILLQKGLGDKFRMYAIRQMSHNGGSTLENGRDGKVRILDLSLLMDGAVDILDAWVEGGTPPPSRSDWPEVGDANRDGVIEHPAISFPEVACPLGVYYPWPRHGSGETSFAAFTGKGIEPADKQKVYVDMNRNGLWDFRETPTEAWRRLGLLEPDETLTRDKYVSCIRSAAQDLVDAGFFNPPTVDLYVKMAQSRNLTPASDDE